MTRWRLLLVLLILATACRPAPGRAAAPPGGKRVVGYFTEWSVYQRGYHVSNIPADKLTHLIYAFARIVDGECALFDSYAATDKAYPGDRWDAGALRGSFRRLELLKKKHPHLKTLIAVGGWTQSGPFSDVALTRESREKFAKSCARFVTKYGFDGVDIDWEYPVGGGLDTNKYRKEDRRNYTLLLAELRKQLDAQGKTDRKPYLLTIAAPAAPATYANLELDRIHAQLDWLNLMTYDFHGGWSPLTHFNAPLYPAKDDPGKDETVRDRFNADSAVKGYLKAGVPADKVVLGVPFYGRGWAGVPDANRGLYQKPGRGLPKGTWEAGVFDYKDLVKNYVGKYQRHRHADAKVPWLFDPRAGVMISYDDPESLRAKAAYAAAKNLGGVMVWELSADDAEASLLTAVAEGLRAKPK